MKIVFLDAKTLGDDIHYDSFSELGEVEIFPSTEQSLVETRISDADVVVINKIKLNESNLKNAEKLKLICVAATGYDNIDVAYCKANCIGVCNVVGYSTHSVAQVTLSMALTLVTHITEYTDYVNSGQYTKSGIANRLTPVYHELCGKTWGIIGLGNIGKQVARVAKSMGCNVLGFKRSADHEFNTCDLQTLLKTSDIISVHIPLNDETRKMIGENEIACMKQNVIFINVARGAVTDEKALADAILSKRIAGLGVDVYEQEPFALNHPYQNLLGLPNVCFTPHMAWGAYEARVRCLDEIKQNIQSYFKGEIRNRLDLL